MALSDLLGAFRGQPAQIQQTQPMQPTQPSQPQNATVPGNGEARSDGTGPGAFPAAKTGSEDPLEKFSSIWDKDPKAPAKPNPVPNIKPTSEQLNAAVAGLDFTKTVAPELMEKALKGDTASLMQVINTTAQQTLAAASGTTANIVTEALTAMNKKYEDEIIPGILRAHNSRTEISKANPIFDDPASKPMLAYFEAQLQTKFPTATPSEHAEMAKEYLLGFTQKFAKGEGMEMTKIPDKPKTAAGDTDWDAWFKG